MLQIYLVPNEFYIFICKHGNFNVLNKLSLKCENASGIINDFIVEHNEHFPGLKEYFRTNAQVYQYIYALLFSKYFYRVDDYGVKSKVAFEIAYGNYKNEKENMRFVSEMPIMQEVLEASEVVETCQPPSLSTSAPEVDNKE